MDFTQPGVYPVATKRCCDVKPLNNELETVDPGTLNETAPVIVKLPERPNSIGLIDDQHRVFAYHETRDDDAEIAKLRIQQNLLVTGIIFPANVTNTDREKFEARLFLEINSTQMSAKSPIKQAIGLVLDPFSAESIATRLLERLGKEGPLAGLVQRYFYDKEKLKTASIVSYGLKPLVKTGGTDSMFVIWTHTNKEEVSSGSNGEALSDYISFCTSSVNQVLGAIRQNLPKERWTTDPSVQNRVLTTTYVNSFLISIRLLIENKAFKLNGIKNVFSDINNIDFSLYHSSQYKRMAEKIVESYIKN